MDIFHIYDFEKSSADSTLQEDRIKKKKEI